MINKIHLVIILLGASFLYSCGYASYDECIVGEMENQDQLAYRHVSRVCESKFPYEKRIPVSSEYRLTIWEQTAFEIVFVKGRKESEYTITKAEVGISKKSCENLRRDSSRRRNFDHIIKVSFDSKGMGRYVINDASLYKCIIPLQYYGVLDV